MSVVMKKQSKEPPSKHKIRGLGLELMATERKRLVEKLAAAVKNDKDLDLQIRPGSLNVYYKGGSLLKIDGFPLNLLKPSFNTNYFKRKEKLDEDRRWYDEICSDISMLVENIPKLKRTMDGWFADDNKKNERDLQHQLSCISTKDAESKWIILDIEYSAWLHGERENRSVGRRQCQFDMVMIERSSLQSSDPLTVYIIELKQGNGALDGRAGIADHAEDLKQFIDDAKDGKAREAFKQSVKNILSEKSELGLLPAIVWKDNGDNIQLKALFLLDGSTAKPEIVAEAAHLLGVHGTHPLFNECSNFFKTIK